MNTFRQISEALNIVCLILLLATLVFLAFGCATPRSATPYGTKLVQRVCPDTEIQVATAEEWSKDDQRNLDIARQRCGEKFPRSPCVVKFTRYAPLRYSAICGAARDQ